MDRNELIERIVAVMDDWDRDTLLAWAKTERREDLDRLEDEDIRNIADTVLGDWEQEEYDNEG